MIDKKINKRTYIKSKTKRRDTNADRLRDKKIGKRRYRQFQTKRRDMNKRTDEQKEWTDREIKR